MRLTHNLLNISLHPHGACFPHLISHMAIDIQSKRCGCMSKISLNRFDIIAGADGGNSILMPNILSDGLRAVSEPDNHACTKRTGIDPALAFNIERMLGSRVDGFLLALGILNGHMGDLIRCVDKGTDDFFVGNLADDFNAL